MSGLYVPGVLERPASQLIGPWSPEALGEQLLSTYNGSTASAVWPTANLAIGYPFHLSEPRTALSMWLANGAVVSGNVDVGIYTAAGVKIVSKGSTAHTGTSVDQPFDITDTPLVAGVLYYAWLAISNVTATVIRKALHHVSLPGAIGMQQMASAFPLPSTITPAVPANNYVPLFGLSFVGTY